MSEAARAVAAADVRATFAHGPQDLPFHLHAAEQTGEVERRLAHLSARPVECLLDNLPLSERFHLVHCTHLTPAETTRLAQLGAHVVLCPGGRPLVHRHRQPHQPQSLRGFALARLRAAASAPPPQPSPMAPARWSILRSSPGWQRRAARPLIT